MHMGLSLLDNNVDPGSTKDTKYMSYLAKSQ